MRWRRRATTGREPSTSREELAGGQAAFDAAYADLCDRMRGQRESAVRDSLLTLLRAHQQSLSPAELELFTVEAVDPDWAAKDPNRAAELMRRLEEEEAAETSGP